MKQKLKALTTEMKENKTEEMKEIEEICCLEMKEIIFDSDCCDWEIYTSIFKKIVEKKKQLIFLIETETNKKFGCYIDSEIIINKWKYVVDPKAFIFSLDANTIKKYNIIEYSKAIQIYPSNNDYLFEIGNYIEIMKHGLNKKSRWKSWNKTYNYEEEDFFNFF